ncbi:MAG TPA: precorrin-6y C5,15-methyltransferase (decarboxylating) subunit CbiE [Chloroflexota bacterium]
MREPRAIAVVGLSPDNLSLSPKAQKLIEHAEVLAGGKRQLARFAEHPAERILVANDALASVEAIRRAEEAGRRVVVLASGDPLLYGIGATLVRELGQARVKILPAVSSVQLAFACAGEPWHDATILSAHGRELHQVLMPAMQATKLAVLTDAVNTPAAVCRALSVAGVEDCRAIVCENLGEPNERITHSRLKLVAEGSFAEPNVLLLLRQPGAARLHFGRPDGDFESVRGQITKAEVRAVALSKLRLAPAGVLWDVGAGSGALAIEAAGLMPRGAVYAIERDADHVACLRRNAARHGAGNVRVIQGEAPEALAGLPAPDAVFVGGSGGRLAELLDVLPRPLVMNLALLQHVSLVLEHFRDAEVVQLGVARSSSIASGHRLASLNPVFIVAVPA